MKRTASRWATPLATAGWGLAIGAGFLALGIHEATPGPTGAAVPHWPGRSRIPLDGDRPTLVMAAHPRCPCSRASVAELARLVTRCPGRVEVYVLIFAPEGAGPNWESGAWLRRLGTVPGVHLVADTGGVEAARFGARTSGQVAFYATDGRLLFRGGLTRARGHQGASAGQEAILGLIAGDPAASPVETPVFGCSLVEPPFARGALPPWIN